MKHKKLSLFSIFLTLLLCIQTTNASSFRTSAHRIYKSVVGIRVLKIGVKGDYRVSRNKITSWSNSRCDNTTYVPLIKKLDGYIEHLNFVIIQISTTVLTLNG